MKIECHCGALIVDQTDDLPHKAHLIPDQEWFATLDRIDAEVIEPLAARRLTAEGASMRTRSLLIGAVRMAWQCRSCGRLYVDDASRELRCFVPEAEHSDHELLRSRPEPPRSRSLRES